MEPLARIAEFESTGQLSRRLTSLIRRRISWVQAGVRRIERAAGLLYPTYYVEPVLPLAASSAEPGRVGVLYARTVPVEVRPTGVRIVVQLTAPLVAFATKTSLAAVLGHEFQHYVDLVRRFTRLNVTSAETVGTLFEAGYADVERLFSAELLFRDKALVRLIRRRFPNGFRDPGLDAKTRRQWLAKGLPTRTLGPEENTIRISMTQVLASEFDPQVRMRLQQLEGQALLPRSGSQ